MPFYYGCKKAYTWEENCYIILIRVFIYGLIWTIQSCLYVSKCLEDVCNDFFFVEIALIFFKRNKRPKGLNSHPNSTHFTGTCKESLRYL